MFNKVRVLVWEHRKKTVKGLFFIAVAMAIYALLLSFARDLILRIFALSPPLAMGMAFAPLLAAAALLFMNENRNVVSFSYPPRIFILPVHTGVLVATEIIYKLVVVGALAWAGGIICKTFISSNFVIWPQVLLAVILIVALQALVFLARAYGTATGLTVFFVIGLASIPLFRLVTHAVSFNFFALWRDVHFQRYYVDLPVRGTFLAAVACTILWWVTAFIGARRARSEVPEDRVGIWISILTRIAHFERSDAEFSSPEAAQRWYEWRRGAYLFPWIGPAAGLVLLVVFYAFRIHAQGMYHRFQMVLVLLVFTPAAVACIIGYTLTRDDPIYTWFVGARPISTKSISGARFAASVRGILLGYGLLLITSVIVYRALYPANPYHLFLVQDLRETTQTTGPFVEGVMMLAFYFALVVLGVWSLFWLGRAAGAAVWIATLPAAIHFYEVRQLYVLSHGETSETYPILMTFAYALTVIAVAAFLISFAVAYKRGYISLASLVASIAAAVALGSTAFVFNDLIPTSIAWPAALFLPTDKIWLAALWLPVPLIPFAALPLTIDWQRHR